MKKDHISEASLCRSFAEGIVLLQGSVGLFTQKVISHVPLTNINLTYVIDVLTDNLDL